MSGDELDDIDAKIAALQAEKARKLAKAEAAKKAEEKAAKQVLIGATPTKNKTAGRLAECPAPPKQPIFGVKSKQAKQVLPSIPTAPQAGPSRLSSSLASLRQKSDRRRSASADLDIVDDPKQKGKAVQRDDDDLTVKHDLRIGPKEHGLDPEGENEWLFMEPNSRIRLMKRSMGHSAVQDYLYGRYYLPPTLLYSVIRLSRDGATYDLPVDGDWLTIAVVAERGEVKISGTKQTTAKDDDDDDEGDNDNGVDGDFGSGSGKTGGGPGQNGRQTRDGKRKEEQKRKRPPRKYINLKLCSLPPRSKSGSSASGDALLQLLLFESDTVARETVVNDDGDEVEVKRYRGGSGGAYEKWCNLTVGSVIAILNPKVLRPLRAGSQAPHPLTLPLALNPTSGDNISLIGQAKDLGRCAAQQKDGNRCRTWVDLRENTVCEYHVHAAVQRGKAGRAEFTASTSSFALTTRPTPNGGGRAGGYDPRKKTGLLPASGAAPAPRGIDNGGGGATYVIGGGSLVNTHRSDGGLKHHGDEHLSEKLGRRRAEKRKKRDEERETEMALQKLMERDGAAQSTGGKYLAQIGVDIGNKSGKGKRTAKEEEEDQRKRAFSAQAIKLIGFDPTRQVGGRPVEDQGKRAQAIELLRNQDKRVRLGKPKGMGFTSVQAPTVPFSGPASTTTSAATKSAPVLPTNDAMIDLD